MTRLITFAAVAALLIGASAANASEFDQPHMTVKYADLNLASANGVKTLYSRIKNASAAACASIGDDRTLGGVNQIKACRNEMASEGVRGMNLRALTQLASGGSAPMQVATH